MRLGGVFKNALGTLIERWLRVTDDGTQIVTTSGAAGPSKNFYYATGGSAATVDIPIPGGAKIAVVTLEGTGIAKACLNAPNNAVRDAWLAQASSLTEVTNARRITPTSDIDDRTFLVNLDSSITKLSFAPDATISAINVRSV